MPSGECRPDLVSVIMAARDAAAYVGDACRSVLCQTHTNLELIVVDDGSSDDTAAIVRRLAESDRRVQLISQPNRGVAAARNAALAAATGEFVAPLDADDLWDERKLEQQVARLAEAGSNAGLAYCWWLSIGPDGTILDRSPRWRIEGDVLPQLLEVNFTGNASVPLFRRALVEALGGYDPSLYATGRQGCEDWDLAIRVAERAHVAAVPHVLVAYRRHTGSMSTSREAMWQSQLKVTSDLAARHPGIAPGVMVRARGQFALYLAGVSFWAGDLADAVLWTLRVRPISLLVGVLPHVLRLLATTRLGTGQRSAVRLSGHRFTEVAPLEPLIPYERVYERRWSRTGVSADAHRRHDVEEHRS